MAWDRYKTRESSIEFRSRVGQIRPIVGYCDEPLAGIYDTKDPICKLTMTPVVQFSNVNLTWDISNSIAPSGTIDTFTINWNGPSSIPDIINEPWTSLKTGFVQYTALGSYIVHGQVVDTLGNRSEIARVQVDIVQYVAIQNVYIGTNDQGLWFFDNENLTPAQRNAGLSAESLKFRHLAIHPASRGNPPDQHHLWATTAYGIAYSLNSGVSWVEISKAQLGQPVGSNPPDTSALDQIDLWFDINDPSIIYVRRTRAYNAWLYWTTDYGATWQNNEILG